MEKRLSTYIAVLLLMLSTAAGAQILKGTLKVGDDNVPAEFLQTGYNTVSVGNGRNACISQINCGGTLTIPSTVVIEGDTYKVLGISRFAFRFCNQLTGVDIQEGITSISEFAFIGCSGIKEITLPASLETLGSQAFASCYEALQSVTCRSQTPPRWESNDVFRRVTNPEHIMYSDTKKLYVPDTEAYAQANFWKYFADVKFGEAVYHVYDATDLTLLRERVNMGNERGPIMKVVLEDDIDMSGVTWSGGIGLSEVEPFVGNFDGQGHTITGLTISGDDCPAFFSHFGGRSISNVTFRDCQITNTSASTGYAGVVVGETGYVMIDKVWVENCSVTGGEFAGGIVGHSLSTAIQFDDCVVKDITLASFNRSAGLIGCASGGNAYRCAVIGNCSSTRDVTIMSILYFDMSLHPFVGKCVDGEDFYVHDSYASHRRFTNFQEDENIQLGTDVALCGRTLDIIDAEGNPTTLTLDESSMKSLFMVPILGNLWIYCEGEYPMSYAFNDVFPPQVNKATYSFEIPSNEMNMPVNRLYANGMNPRDFLNHGPSGFRSKSFLTSRIWMDDNFADCEGALPIGTATITSRGGVIYDRVLQACVGYTATEKAQLIDVDKDGEAALTNLGQYIPIGEEVVIDEEEALLPMGFSVCLPYDLWLNGTSRVFQPAGFGKNGRLTTVISRESSHVEAWKPCIVTVENDSIPLGTSAPVVFRPKRADSDFTPSGSPYAVVGTRERKSESGRAYYDLKEGEIWSKTEAASVLPFRAYITAPEDGERELFSTGMGYRAELKGDSLLFSFGLPVTDAELQWWLLDYFYESDDDDYFYNLAWRKIADKVSFVNFDQTFSSARPWMMEGWFYGFSRLAKINGLEYLNTSEVVSMYKLFGKCSQLIQLDLRHFDTRQVDDMYGMFDDCSCLNRIIIGKDWSVENLSRHVDMFRGCIRLVGQYGKTYNEEQITHKYANASPDGYLWKDYPYYIAEHEGSTVVFRGSDTAPDGVTSYDTSDTGHSSAPWHHWYHNDNENGLAAAALIDPSFALARPVSCYDWFYTEENGLSSISGLQYLNTSRVTDMGYMFANCRESSIDASGFDTYNVVNMQGMFARCGNLKDLDVSNFNTCNVTNMSYMFDKCNSLETLDVSNFKTFDVENMRNMFNECASLRELDLNSFNISSLKDAVNMFSDCNHLETLWCNDSWQDIGTTNYMFFSCNNLKGAVAYSPELENDGSMANPETGYFTAYPAVKFLDNGDNTDIFVHYGRQKVNVTYDRVLRAIDNGDGTWKSRAYSICLPYDLNFVKSMAKGDARAYKLYAATSDNEFVFSASPYGGVLKAGHAYLIVVNEGEVSLNAQGVVLSVRPFEGESESVGMWGNLSPETSDMIAGTWRGTFEDIPSADAAAMQAYGLWEWKGTPYFMRVRPDTPTAFIKKFRAFFVPRNPMPSNTYALAYKQWVNGDDEDPIVSFMADTYDIEEFPDDYDTAISEIDGQAIDPSWLESIYDLQGRKLPSRPAQGVYIVNGKKMVKK